MHQSITEEAWELVHSLATQCGSENGLGSMSPAPYDTAWVAMVEKINEDGTSQPLFPEAYNYLKRTQCTDGLWAAETSDTDGIINSLAALLALKKQERQPGTSRAVNKQQCRTAEDALRQVLNSWDLNATDRVGLEVLVPNLLKLLEAEGVYFDFPSRAGLMTLNAVKLARLGPILTSPTQTTLIHTLEAFVGTLDFDRVKHHKMPNGSMLGSPSSTAAYLINCSTWDLDAEAYLSMVYHHQWSVGNRGGFPSAFPSTLFEISWALNTLLEAGFDKDDFLLSDIRKLTVFLETSLTSEEGIVGFAPSSLPDADDTAKTISTLRHLGWDQDVQPMLEAFETESAFMTYRGERNASTSANCNILMCLLRSPHSVKYTKQIVKCVRFLSDSWEHSNEPDKWHTSVRYLMMLMAQSFVLFVQKWAKDELDMGLVSAKMIRQDIPRTVLHILSRTIGEQQDDGSWESKREVTAYAVLTLAPLLSLPWVDFMKSEGIAAMYRGKAYLESNRSQWRNAERLWIEKTVYSSSNLAQAYCLAASKIISISPFLGSQKVAELFHPELRKSMAKMVEFFSHINPFCKQPKWILQLSLLQGVQYAATLQESRYDIFPPIENASDEKYQEYIPFTWIGCRDILHTSIPSKPLLGMMLVSMLGFQVDAYMETVVWERYQDRLPALKAFIRTLFSGSFEKRKRDSDGGSELVVPSNEMLPSVNGVENVALGSHANGTRCGLSENIVARRSICNRVSNAPKRTRRNRATTIASAKIETLQQKRRSGNKRIIQIDNGAGGHEKPSDSLNTECRVLDSSDIRTLMHDDSDIESILTKFVYFVLHHPKVIESPLSLQAWLKHELRAYLLSHIAHLEDDAQLQVSARQSNGSCTLERPRTTFFNWVRTTSADSTSCSYAFVFFLCLIEESGKNSVTNIHQRYALEDACHHLATTVRQYNDFGSVARDHDEGNLNSINFPEFNIGKKGHANENDPVGQRKRDLLAVAAYERRCLDRVLRELESSLDARVMEKLRLFIQVTDLFGEIYVARDIGVRRMESRKKGTDVSANENK